MSRRKIADIASLRADAVPDGVFLTFKIMKKTAKSRMRVRTFRIRIRVAYATLILNVSVI